MKKWVIIALLLVLVGGVFASFEIGDLSHQITTDYGPGENIRGWINMSFEDEPVDSLFKDSEDNTVTLIKLLESDSSLSAGDYNCTPFDCGVNYDEENGDESKTIELDEGDEKLIGFRWFFFKYI